MFRPVVKSLLLLFLLGSTSCVAPPVPPEVSFAETLERRLRGAGAADVFPAQYQRYRHSLRSAKNDFLRERNRFVWFRDYEPVRIEYRTVLAGGSRLMDDLRRRRVSNTSELTARLDHLESRIDVMMALTESMNEGRLARRNLTKAQLAMNEVRTLSRKGNYDQARKRVFEAEVSLRGAEAALKPILDRYTNASQLATWRHLVDDTLRESREDGSTVIIVSKVDRKLTIFRGGTPVRTYRVGLGRNGMSDKLYSGDNATPEGSYRVVSKFPTTRYHKALLIDYPNDEDRRRYSSARSRGLIPSRRGIGNGVEIHGGGNDGMTYGCIALEDRHMDEVYKIIDVGTRVTIVGATERNGFLASAIDSL